MKRREAEGKGKKERCSFECRVQREARRNKKAFLNDQCKEIEENKRMGKNGDLFKKIRDTKGTFHANMDSVKDRKGFPDSSVGEESACGAGDLGSIPGLG